MKATNIKKNGKKLSKREFEALILDLKIGLVKKLGYDTRVEQTNSQAIKIGLWRASFKVNVEVHGYNTRNTPGIGQRRTKTPTWDQRVEFNNEVNRIFNIHGLTANIKSGPFTIRKSFHSYNENNWYEEKPEYITSNEAKGYFIEGFDYKKTGA